MNFKSLAILHDATKATGTGRPLEVAAFSCAALVVTGTFVATITWQGTADGSNWVDLLAYNPTTGNWSTTAIAPGTYVIPTVGLQDVRASVAWTSGTSVTIKGMVSEVPVPLPNLFTEVAINGSNVSEHTFHNAATAPGQGTPLQVDGAKTLTVEIWGTSTSRTIEFKAAGPSGAYRQLAGVRLADLVVASSTTDTGELWQFDVTGLASVVIEITAIGGGNVSIAGRVVA